MKNKEKEIVRLPDGDRILTLKEVALMLRCSISTLRRRSDNGLIRPLNDRGPLKFLESEVMRYLETMKGEVLP